MAKSFPDSSIDADREVPAGQSLRPVVDDEVLDVRELCNRCLGNLDLVQRVLDKFEQRLPEELAELERVLEFGDPAKIALVAHRIKGNASNISATGLQQAAAEIEDLARAGQMADVPARLGNLHEQWRRYVDCRDALRLPAGGTAITTEAIS